ITEEQIQELTKSARAARTLQIFSPVSGVVVEKMNQSLEGMKVTPGMNVYRIADLSTVWAEIEVFEHQIQFLRLGQTAQIAVDAFPGRRWSGKIIYIDPSVNAQTRTLKAHVEIPNADRKLRPGMYANIAIRVPTVSGALKVPEEAILRTGERSVVIVAKGQGVFEPREVRLGATGGGYREVRQGLSADEIVVISSQFLIDSESSMKEAISKMLTVEKGEGEPEAASALPNPR
ncbi:MAG: efflux RND transporter periplasmic adaptor subunit, partial [Acidobacteria bacterium]|nr:efflux RND transporter periplasmic adaptor subunit [Acidobacteriota bacterium]